ncbi:hypothetical protein EV421DRAFT_331995 [Armillaria borealis]|uniref:Uncharacterized protein n=1 Tax=Armillaria borealis TaxID=47425 RepID=A0AA39ITN3_9AGAR|nr:hypothetical protein EV421DRAFT_331995 [Armillaria borealis]
MDGVWSCGKEELQRFSLEPSNSNHQALFSVMWLQGLDDKDNVEHRALFYHQVGCSSRSFQFIVRPLFPGLPYFTKPFLPCPVLVSCVCVPLCSRASWFLCLRSGSVPVHRCSCVCVTVVFLFRCFDPASVYRACLPVSFGFVGSSTVPDSLGSVRHVSQLCLVMFGCLPPPTVARVLPVFPLPRVTFDLLVLFPYNYCTALIRKLHLSEVACSVCASEISSSKGVTDGQRIRGSESQSAQFTIDSEAVFRRITNLASNFRV